MKRLSEREREILSLVSHGHSNKYIGGKVGIHPHNVSSARKQICKKLGAANSCHAVATAIAMNLIK